MMEAADSSETSVHIYHCSRRYCHDNCRSHRYRLNRGGLRKVTQNTSSTADAAPQTPVGHPRNAIRNCYRLGQQPGTLYSGKGSRRHCWLAWFRRNIGTWVCRTLLASVSIVKTSLHLMSEHVSRLSDTQIVYIDNQLHRQARRRVSAFVSVYHRAAYWLHNKNLSKSSKYFNSSRSF